jgi:hypothetical protein
MLQHSDSHCNAGGRAARQCCSTRQTVSSDCWVCMTKRPARTHVPDMSSATCVEASDFLATCDKYSAESKTLPPKRKFAILRAGLLHRRPFRPFWAHPVDTCVTADSSCALHAVNRPGLTSSDVHLLAPLKQSTGARTKRLAQRV